MTDDPAFLAKLVEDVTEYARSRGGRIYAPIEHPAFDDIPYQHGPERFDILEPHIPPDAKTALDIGTHWGYFAHRLERHGLQVTAAEVSPSYLDFLTRIREVCGATFEVYPHSVFTLPDPVDFDVVLGLNIFHHFTKTEKVFEEFTAFLHRLSCRVLFFQAHNPEEGQMTEAYMNPAPDDFAELIRAEAGLSEVSRIGIVGRRPMFAISR